MITDKENTRISKLLSYALRHKPEEIGITLDDNGWTDVQILLQKLDVAGEPVTRETLQYIVDTNNK